MNLLFAYIGRKLIKGWHYLFSTKWGRWLFLFIVFSVVIGAWILDGWGEENIPFIFENLQEKNILLILENSQKGNIPWVFVVLGLISIVFAANYFWLTQGSQFVVNYKVESFYNLMSSDESYTEIPYISQIYIRNKKNKFEAIQSIWLQIDKKTIIWLASYTKNPLLLEPFKSITRELSPVTHYHSTIFGDHPRDGSKEKNFILKEESKYYGLLDFWVNKIIIQTEDGIFPVEKNLIVSDADLNKFKKLSSSINYGKYGTVLSGKIRAVYYMEMESKPEDIHDQDAWRAFCMEQEFLGAWEKDKKLSTKNLKDKFIKNKLDQFGLQVVMMKDSGEYSAQYYALTKDNKKYMINSPVSWWEDFYQPYKNCLEKEKADISSERKKLPEPISDIFMSSLKELIGEKRVTMIKEYFSYKDTDPEGYYLIGKPFRSFHVFCLLLHVFLQERKPTMKIINPDLGSDIKYAYWNDFKGWERIGVHCPEDIVYDIGESLDKANALPNERKKTFVDFFLQLFSKARKTLKELF